MDSTIDCARHRWSEILPRLGIDTKFLTGKHTACPLCGGRDRYRFTDRHGDGDYYCHQCGAGNGLILIRKKNNWDFRTAVQKIDEIIGRGAPLKQKPVTDETREKARRLKRIVRTIAECTDQRVIDAFLLKRRLRITSTVL